MGSEGADIADLGGLLLIRCALLAVAVLHNLTPLAFLHDVRAEAAPPRGSDGEDPQVAGGQR